MRPNVMFLFILMGIWLATPRVSAQNTLVELENMKSMESTYSLDGTYTTFINTNTYKWDTPSHQIGQNHLFTGRLHLPQSYLLSTTFWLNQDFKNEKDLTLRDSLVILSKPMGEILSGIHMTGRAGFTLPLSERSDETDGLITAFRLNPIFTHNANWITKDLTLIYRPTFNYNIHQFKTSLRGKANTDYSVTNRITVLYRLYGSLYLSLDNTYIRSWTYYGATDDFFSLDQSLSVNLTQNLNGFIGHSLGDNALSVNGQESSIRIFDERNSKYYFGISYRF